MPTAGRWWGGRRDTWPNRSDLTESASKESKKPPEVDQKKIGEGQMRFRTFFVALQRSLVQECDSEAGSEEHETKRNETNRNVNRQPSTVNRQPSTANS